MPRSLPALLAAAGGEVDVSSTPVLNTLAALFANRADGGAPGPELGLSEDELITLRNWLAVRAAREGTRPLAELRKERLTEKPLAPGRFRTFGPPIPVTREAPSAPFRSAAAIPAPADVRSWRQLKRRPR
jgi:hypothetical protein